MSRLAVAFIVTSAAGLATTIGAALVFWPHFYKPQVLAGCLALAAGVLIYVSFIELFFKAHDEFEVHFNDEKGVNKSLISAEDYEPPTEAYLATTGMFFFGLVFTWVMDRLIHKAYKHFGPAKKGDGHLHLHTKDAPPSPKSPHPLSQSSETDSTPDSYDELEMFSEGRQHLHGCRDFVVDVDTGYSEFAQSIAGVPKPKDMRSVGGDSGMDVTGGDDADVEAGMERKRESLLIMSLITGAAIATHNFPEGLATFVSLANDPSVGAPIAVAIAIHNIPEGICVAVPIYFATKSKMKGFVWGTLSGLAESLAGAIGWAIVGSTSEDSDLDSLAYAMLFGLVTGMMIYISFRELLPTARGYDPKGNIVNFFFFVGMAIMALSLLLFKL